jgi:hypothetical protein
MRPFMKTPARGAATSIHLASAPDLEQVTGRYFASSKPRRSSKRSYDRSRDHDQPGQREGRLKPPASCIAGTVRISARTFTGTRCEF